jgi:hypothetical protein
VPRRDYENPLVLQTNYSQLEMALRNNVCELFIKRRIPVEGRPAFRRMLCSNSMSLLNSSNGRRVLGYRRPNGLPPFNPREKKLIITWDILMMDFRCINYNECYLVTTYPVSQAREFWKIFNKVYLNMTPNEKLYFMDS